MPLGRSEPMHFGFYIEPQTSLDRFESAKAFCQKLCRKTCEVVSPGLKKREETKTPHVDMGNKGTKKISSSLVANPPSRVRVLPSHKKDEKQKRLQQEKQRQQHRQKKKPGCDGGKNHVESISSSLIANPPSMIRDGRGKSPRPHQQQRPIINDRVVLPHPDKRQREDPLPQGVPCRRSRHVKFEDDNRGRTLQRESRHVNRGMHAPWSQSPVSRGNLHETGHINQSSHAPWSESNVSSVSPSSDLCQQGEKAVESGEQTVGKNQFGGTQTSQRATGRYVPPFVSDPSIASSSNH